jgi:hypothetical protein
MSREQLKSEYTKLAMELYELTERLYNNSFDNFPSPDDENLNWGHVGYLSSIVNELIELINKIETYR